MREGNTPEGAAPREGDTPEGAAPKGLGWPLHREKKKNLNEMKAGNPSQTQKIGQY